MFCDEITENLRSFNLDSLGSAMPFWFYLLSFLITIKLSSGTKDLKPFGMELSNRV